MDGTDAPAPSSTFAPGAAGTSTPPPRLKFKGLKPPRRHPRGEVVGPTLKRDIAILKASGMTTASVAKTLKRNPTTIERVQRLPEVQQTITELRQAWKQESQSQVTQLAGDTWQMVGEFVTARDSKQLDNTMRAVAAMEKVSASVSGEGQKVEVTGTLTAPPQMELKVLVGRLFGAPDDRTLGPRGD